MPYFHDHYGSLAFPLAPTGGQDGKGFRRAQIGAIHAISSHFTLRDDPAIAVLPTGSGKTAVLIATAFLQRPTRVLVVTPSRLVRRQIANEFSSLSTLKRIGAIRERLRGPKTCEITERITDAAGWEDLQQYDVVVAIPQSSSPALEGIPSPPADLFDLVLVDEAHHSPAKTWNELFESFRESKKVLITATPFRRDRKEIRGRLVYVYPLREAYRDQVFGRIEYRPVQPAEDEDVDLAIAREAERVFQADRDAGLSHFLMVRTDSKKRADELKEVYAANTGLNLRLIHSGHSYRHVMETVDQLTSRDLDGIICVDMLGEGFDFPGLKIAAIHSPHKSLAVTLQFIGRFARTNADDIGTAKFLAATTTDIEEEIGLLYQEGAGWQDIVANLSEGRISEEVSVREFMEDLEPPAGDDISEELDVSPYSLQPYSHVKIYQIADDFNVDAEIDLKPFELVHHRVNRERLTSVFILRDRERPKWTSLDVFARTEYHLFVVYFDSDTRLLFINSTVKSVEMYERVAAIFTQSKPRILPLNRINNVLAGIDETEFFNIGMRTAFRGSNSESYRIITGPGAQKAIDKSDGRLFHRGHIFGRGKDGDRQVTIGYSSSSKVWANSTVLVPKLVGWCRGLADKISRAGGVMTRTGLDYLSVGASVTEIPPNVIAAEWNFRAYRNPPIVTYPGANGHARSVQLLDLDLSIDRASTNDERICVIISGEETAWPVEFSFQTEDFYMLPDPAACEGVAVNVKGGSLSLAHYLNLFPASFYFSDLSRLELDELFTVDRDRFVPFDTGQMDPVDWAAANVDIQTEFGVCADGRLSIHAHLEVILKAGVYDVVFYDHRKGEIADFICLRREADSVRFALYHCKKSGGPRTGDRVEDLFEVCGQAVKSLQWIHNNARLLAHIKRRILGASRFCKGTMQDLERLVDETRVYPTLYEVCIVQPGISASRELESDIAELLTAANDHIVNTKCDKLRLLCSP